MRRWIMLSALCCAIFPATAADFEPVAMPGWHLGAQAWTFNKKWTLLETIDQCKALGIEYLEAYPGQTIGGGFEGKFQPGCPPEALAAVKAKLAETGVKLDQYGVVGLPNNEDGARKVFDFAKEMGIPKLSSEPAPEALPMLDKLCEEYDMRIALHNHPKPSKYWDPQTVLDAVAGCSNRIGACADTGHWVRSGLDPIECLKKLEGRIVSLHFKDLNQREQPGIHDVPWGSGASDAAGQLAELKRQGFQGLFSIEYEYWNDELLTNLAQCVSWFHSAAAELAKP